VAMAVFVFGVVVKKKRKKRKPVIKPKITIELYPSELLGKEQLDELLLYQSVQNYQQLIEEYIGGDVSDVDWVVGWDRQGVGRFSFKWPTVLTSKQLQRESELTLKLKLFVQDLMESGKFWATDKP
jgi:hypothetical protein